MDLPLVRVWGNGVAECTRTGRGVQICPNMRRKTDVLRRDDTGLKMKLHKNLHNCVTPNQNTPCC